MSSVVDQDIDSPKSGLGSIHQTGNIVRVRQVGLPGLASAAKGLDRLDNFAGVPGENPIIMPRPGLVLGFAVVWM